MMRIFSYALLLIGVVFFSFAAFRKTSGFSAANCRSEIPNSNKWEIPLSHARVEEVNALLNQPYSYVGRGYLSYGFLSQDGKCLVRLVRHQRLAPHTIFNYVPFSYWKEGIAKKRHKRQVRLFKSYLMAYEKLPQESGVLFVHLSKNVPDVKDVWISSVNLSATEFVLQQRGEDVIETIDRLMKNNQIGAAKEKIDQLFLLLKSTSQKGVVNWYRPSATRLNVAFLPDRAIFIDSGKLSYRPKVGYRGNFEKNLQALRPLDKWLMHHYTPLSCYYHEQCKRFIQEQKT